MGRGRNKAGSVGAIRYDVFGNPIGERATPNKPASPTVSRAQLGRTPSDFVGSAIVDQFRKLFGGVPIGASRFAPNVNDDEEIVRLLGRESIDEPVTYDILRPDNTREYRTGRPTQTEFNRSQPTAADIEWGNRLVTVTDPDGTVREITQAQQVVEAYARASIYANLIKQFGRYDYMPEWSRFYDQANDMAFFAHFLSNAIRPDGTVDTAYMRDWTQNLEANTRIGQQVLSELETEMTRLAAGMTAYSNNFYPGRQFYTQTPARTKADLKRDAKVARKMRADIPRFISALDAQMRALYPRA